MKGVTCFEPNDVTHKAFGDALRDASAKGVKVLAYDCNVTPDTLKIDNLIPVNL
jgi:sugar fermentation stimulation protein A